MYMSFSGANGEWFDIYKRNFGDPGVFENVLPGAMVDTQGNFYFVLMDAQGRFGGGSFYCYQITTTYQEKNKRILISDRFDDNYDWDHGYVMNSGGPWQERVWHVLKPCIAQEISSSDYIYLTISVPTAKYWNIWAPVLEGIMLLKIKKSDMSIASSYFYYGSVYSSILGEYYSWRCISTRALYSYSRNVYAAIHDPAIEKVLVFWLHHWNVSSWLADGNVCLNTLSYAYTQRYPNECCCTVEGNNPGTFYEVASCLEPSITKSGGNYHLLVSERSHPIWYKIDINKNTKPNRPDVIWHQSNPYMCKLETNSSTQDAYLYRSDQHVIQHNGKNLSLTMAMTRISHLKTASIPSKALWSNSLCVPWNDQYIALVISSCYENGSIDIYPNNIIEVFPVTAATGGTTSMTTLYKNTHKFVLYDKNNEHYLIYAYCYPGKKKHLYLGVCRYSFDNNDHVNLSIKREFRNTAGESFGKLTDCARIVFMDLRNGQLWIAFATANEKEFWYFHAKADDIVQFAPKIKD